MAARKRLLALEVRPQRIGFVVLQGASQLLDWGVRAYGKEKSNSPAVGWTKIATLLELYSPTVIVIRRRSSGATTSSATPAVAAKIAAEARRRSISCRFVSGKEVPRFFARYGGTTKFAVAALLAEWFPDLVWKLPPKRRPWESEHYNTLVFDAAATAMAFLARD